MIGIIGAMSIEIDGLVAIMDERKTISCGIYNYEVGKIFGKEVVVCRCGIGKVFSSTATALMIEKFAPVAIINIGVAGGAKPLCQGDIVVSKRTVQHDYDGTADGLKLGQVHGFDSQYFYCDENLVNSISKVIDEFGYSYIVGTVATGDCFVSDNAKSSLPKPLMLMLLIWKVVQLIRYATYKTYLLLLCAQYQIMVTIAQ